MNLTDASANQPDFDAVMSGSATDDQCANVGIVAEQLRAYLQEASLRAKALPQRRDDYFALLPVGVQATVKSAIDAAALAPSAIAAPTTKAAVRA